MKNTSSIPPLASPHGEGTSAPRLNENRVWIPVHLQPASHCRYVKFQFTIPITLAMLVIGPLVGSLLVFPIEVRRLGLLALPLVALLIFAAILLLALPPSLLLQLCSKRRFEVWISKNGLTKHYPKRDIYFRWSKFVWMLEIRGDVWLASATDGCFIPRESFQSREEAREFLSIARELKGGGAWRDEWNRRVFGFQDNPQ